ncbi:asparaginyl-tRNA synthetase [Phanerochaete sordida]|uniref:asparagine--tRNA ligase n=1 Tax=Phanerochaete sordida TaxID=48140 RepID=A0A9P3GH31_9APHY|nr:asparaginyl-tRNA synthetase [Phanerochaete sordida]
MSTTRVLETTGSGDAGKPLALALVASHADVKPFVRKDAADTYVVPVQVPALKKRKSGADGLDTRRKEPEELAEREVKEKIERERRAKRIEESKNIVLTEDESLPQAKKTKIRHLEHLRGQRVFVSGWVHRLHSHEDSMVIVLRDGTGYLQCALSGKVAQTYAALTLTLESSVQLHGVLQVVPESKTAPGGHELSVDFWKVLGAAPGGDDALADKLNEKCDQSVLADMRHLVLRGETASAVLKLRAALLASARTSLVSHNLLEVTPQCLLQTQVEGGATHFELDYYGQRAFLTRSSQFYLETCLPSLGDVFCVQESFRVEQAHTRRHLSEYTHLEAELAFITFDDLMSHIETIICETIDRLLANPATAALIKQLSPDFTAPSRPFLRMPYIDAIQWLNAHGIQREAADADGNAILDAAGNTEMVAHAVGDDIGEAAERRMTDILGVPVFLHSFPAAMKAFYMKRLPAQDGAAHVLTESCDLLVPGVGEIAGGSMRMTGQEELLAALETQESVDVSSCYWFTDQRKYGTCEHGGYGVGVERFLAWVANRHTVRECSLYPRWPGRVTP